ncbi:MAG: ComEC family competence protein [Pedobacter sp.]|nr:MAG: ComEC family competence protein [Pedobacter sp.]
MARLFFVKMGFMMMLGIFCAFEFEGLFTTRVITWTLVLLTTALIAGKYFCKWLPIHRFKTELIILSFALYFYGGAWLCLFSSAMVGGNQTSDFVWLRLIDEPQYKTKIMRCKALLITERPTVWPQTAEHILLCIFTRGSRLQKLKYGDELAVRTVLKAIPAPKKPGEFDIQRWMAVQHIRRQALVNWRDIVVTRQNRGNPIISYFLRLREQKVFELNSLIKDKEAAAVAGTLILGYRADLSAATLSAYAVTGTIHALSVSGMHVGLLYLLLDKPLSFLNRRTISKLIKVVIILIVIWGYALLTGMSPAVMRSALMLTVLIISKALRKNTSGLNVLAFSACALLVSDPLLLFDMGFQLSYLSVLGLITIQPLIRRWFKIENSIVRTIWDAIALSLSAQLFTFPLALYYFHQFPVYFLLSNLLISIPLTVIMYLAIIILTLRLDFLAWPLEQLIILTNKSLIWIAQLPFAHAGYIWVDTFGTCCLYMAVIFLTLGLAKYRVKLLIAGFLCLLAISANRFQHLWRQHAYLEERRPVAVTKFFADTIIIT